MEKLGISYVVRFCINERLDVNREKALGILRGRYKFNLPPIWSFKANANISKDV